MRKRTKLEVMRDILSILKDNRNSMKPTPLLRKSGLSSKRFKEYYFEILKKELVKEVEEKKERRVVLTEEGLRFLEKYKVIIDFIEEFDL